MKKLMVLVFVIGMATAANATLLLEADVEGTPYNLSGSGEELAVGTTVDVVVVQDMPNPMGTGGEMTVTMAASGGSAVDTSQSCGFLPMPTTEPCCWEWLLSAVGFYDNGDGTWYAWMGKTANIGPVPMSGTPGIGSWCNPSPYGGWPYESTIEFSFLTTETTELVWSGTWDGVNMNGVVGGFVNVEPCACYGDITGDNQVSIADLSAIVALLFEDIFGEPPLYTICPPPVGYDPPPEGWECADVTDDGCISIADLSAIVAYLSPAYAGATPPYTGPCIPNP